MNNFNRIFSEIFARREVIEKLSENFSEQKQHEREECLKMIKNLMNNGERIEQWQKIIKHSTLY